MRINLFTNGVRFLHSLKIKLHATRFVWMVFLFAIALKMASATRIIPPPPTVKNFVEESTHIIVGSIEKYAYRGTSLIDGEWGKIFNETSPGKSRVLEASVRVDEVIYQNKNTIKLSRRMSIPVHLSLDRNKQGELIGSKKVFILEYSKSRHEGKIRESYYLVGKPFEIESRPAIEAEIPTQ